MNVTDFKFTMSSIIFGKYVILIETVQQIKLSEPFVHCCVYQYFFIYCSPVQHMAFVVECVFVK